MQDREEEAWGEKSDGLRTCGCSEDVSVGWRITVNKRKSLGLVTDMKLLEKVFTFQKVCFSHRRLMAGHLGLCTKRLDQALLDERLRHIWDNRLSIGKLRTDEDTYQWFRVANRPPRPSDGLGPYRFVYDQSSNTFSFDQGAILAAWDSTIAARWEKQGSVVVLLFDWWFQDPKLKRCLNDEFDLYLWHLREINGRKNIGWLRNIFHSIAQ
jgi:hypothetical protein